MRMRDMPEQNVEISSFLWWHTSQTKPIIEEMLKDTRLRSFSGRAQEPPEHPYVFFIPQICPSFSNIRLQADSFEENMEILKIVKFLLFRKKSKTGKWLKSYFNYSIYDMYLLNREFSRTNWCIFRSPASCLKTVPPLNGSGPTWSEHALLTRPDKGDGTEQHFIENMQEQSGKPYPLFLLHFELFNKN